MEQIFKLKLLERMKKQVRGEISIHIIADKLVVDIVNEHLYYRYTSDNIFRKIVLGLTTKSLSKQIIESYRTWLLSKFFYEKNFGTILTNLQK